LILHISTLVLGLIITELLLFTLTQNSNAQSDFPTNYTFDIKIQKINQLSSGNHTSQVYSAGAVNTNVGDLIGSKIVRSSTYILVSEGQVFIKFNLKIPEEIGSNKSHVEKIGFFLKVDAIKDSEKQARTYILKPQQYSNAELANHKVLGGSIDLQGSKGILRLYLL
jgi:hypothetical protein